MENKCNLCCICLMKDNTAISVLNLDVQGLKYSEKLALCDSTQNWEDESLSLCSSCVEKVNIVFDFIELCKKSSKLREDKLKQLQWANENDLEDAEDFSCDFCKKNFKKKRTLKSHITKMHNKHRDIDTNSVKDEIKDDKSFEKEANNPEKSRKKTKRPEAFTCEYCGKQFNRHQHWLAHTRSKHTFEKPYECKLCEARFTTSHSLLVHTRNHNNEKPYICSTCGKGFVCSGDLFHHNKIHLNKKEYECNVCNKRFNTTSVLRTHKIVKHTEPHEWKYICKICERRFPINSSLTLHLKRHTGVKDHSCHICGKNFVSRPEVMKHFLSHSNEKNFKCELCDDKEYKNKDGLNKHLKIVHDLGPWKPPKLEKKFSCMLCPKKFAYSNKLQRHLLSHTGAKPYKCEFCDKKFSDSSYCKNHIRKEHEELLGNEDGIKKSVQVVTTEGIIT
ncbi:hypothetical protein ABEB36_007265 [Hypothenemus hampei]|uniref:C2H2-type domain-containing protein n=1 Tax=Hypothenemus hampei TaxID=57062 RepID=A0ABD1EWH3_HYPHA